MIATSAVFLTLAVALPLILSIYIYQANFGKRFATAAWLERGLDEFRGLRRERQPFASNDGQNLVGYTYSKDNAQAKGIVLISHGLGGGGHNSYMDVADALTSGGYLVFAYDAMGNDESEGDSVRGLPQGLIDLDYAIRYIRSRDEYADLPLMLFGHSWGAYAAGNALNLYPDIRAVVLVAGFGRSLDIIEEEGRRMMGSGIRVLMPYISMIERIKFGKYSTYHYEDGFKASQAGVMMIHSRDDEQISFENQFARFQGLYRDDPRFEFVAFEDRGHNYAYYSDASREYRDAYNADFTAYIGAMGVEIDPEVKAAYMQAHGDFRRLYELDAGLMDRIVAFYDRFAGAAPAGGT